MSNTTTTTTASADVRRDWPVINVSQLFQLPGHFEVFEWPEEIEKKLNIAVRKFDDKRYFFRPASFSPFNSASSNPNIAAMIGTAISAVGTSGIVNLELCLIKGTFGPRGEKVNYVEDVARETPLVLTTTIWERLKYLTSSVYADKLAADRKRKELQWHTMRQQWIDTYLGPKMDLVRNFINAVTPEFLKDFFPLPLNSSFLDHAMLSKDAVGEFQICIHWFVHNYLHLSAADFVDQLRSKRRFGGRGDQNGNDSESSDSDDDDNKSSAKGGNRTMEDKLYAAAAKELKDQKEFTLRRRAFFGNYPQLAHFADQIVYASGGNLRQEQPDEEELLAIRLNAKYNGKLVNFISTLGPLPKQPPQAQIGDDASQVSAILLEQSKLPILITPTSSPSNQSITPVPITTFAASRVKGKMPKRASTSAPE